MPIAEAAALLRRDLAGHGSAGGLSRVVQRVGPPARNGSEYVRRGALVKRLMRAAGTPLATIVAPAGYGKSTLLCEWAARDQRPFVWLAPVAGQGSEPFEPAPWHAAADTEPEAHVVVIEDAQQVPSDALPWLVEAVLDDLPPGSMLVVASRTEPDLPIGRLRAHRALVEIRMDDLAMTSEEAEALLTQAGCTLDAESVTALVEHTQGWPVALYLAALSLSDDREAAAHAREFGGDNHLVAEYLKDEVLDALPTRWRRFATRTAALDELSGPFCDAVLDQRGSARTLANLARATQLLAPLQPSHQTYRWHPLFRDCLRSKLRIIDPPAERVLQERASTWHATQGSPDLAIEYACMAQQIEPAGALIWNGLPARILRGDGARIRRWLGYFQPAQLSADARLSTAAALAAVMAGESDRAQQWALRASGATRLLPPEQRPASIDAALSIAEAATARSGADGMRQAADRAQSLEPPDSQWRPLALWLRGVGEHLSGAHREAAASLDEASALAGEAGAAIRALSLAQCGMIRIELGEWEQAEELSADAMRLLDESDLDSSPIMALVFATAAATRSHAGSADVAKFELRRGIQLLASLGDGMPWYAAETSILLAHASLWLADVVGARTLLAQASRLGRRVPQAAVFQTWFDQAWSHMDSLAEMSLSGPSSLTIAELRILRFLPSHRSFREIAAQLGVSANTVKTQAHAVYRKLGVASRSEAVARAADAGLLGQH